MLKPTYLYHGTTAEALEEILEQGLKAPSFWGSRRMAEHWGRIKRGEGQGAVVLLKRPLSDFQEAHLSWDGFMEEEPVWFPYQVEGDKHEACARASGDWQESLDILESVIYDLEVRVRAGQVIKLKRYEPSLEDLGI